MAGRKQGRSLGHLTAVRQNGHVANAAGHLALQHKMYIASDTNAWPGRRPCIFHQAGWIMTCALCLQLPMDCICDLHT
jgi:hypothetical protein